MTLEAEAPDASGDAADWITAIAIRRDRDGFVSLFNQFAPRVKSYLLRRGTAEQAAEELTQETLLIVWRKADQFDPRRATAGAWIYTIARNLRVDAARRDRRPQDGRIAEEPCQPPTPEQQVKTAQCVRSLRIALERLPPEQAEVLRLSFFEELTHPEIATETGLPLGTVKSRIRLATAQLRLALADQI